MYLPGLYCCPLVVNQRLTDHAGLATFGLQGD
jgi:hypothetical protein